MAILVCRVTWMPYYQSDSEEAVGGGSYVDPGGCTPHESLNFLPVGDTYYGFVEHRRQNINLNNIGGKSHDKTVTGVLIVFCAQEPETGESLIVGWYNDATVYRCPIDRPGDGLGRAVYFTASEGRLVAVSDRCFRIPRARDKDKPPFGGIGQSFVWYGLNDPRAEGFCKSLHCYMKTRVPIRTPAEVVCESRKREISERLERRGAYRQFIDKKGYRCEACGWSLGELDEEKQSVWKSSFELHHLTPFSELDEGGSRMVRKEDFAVLCASCHRAIHRTEFISNVKDFVATHVRG